MRILAKRNDSWHNLSAMYGQDNRAVYSQDTSFVKLKDTKYWEKYHFYTQQDHTLNVFHHTALVLVGDYAYPVSITSDQCIGFMSVSDNGTLSLGHKQFVVKPVKPRSWRKSVVLPEKMDNPEPDIKFGILFLDGSHNNWVWKDPVITQLPKHNRFYTMFPPEFIWQEIAMSLSKDVDTPLAVSDDVKIQQAGFDLKTSFRGK